MFYIKCISVGKLRSNCYIVYNQHNEAIVIDPGDESKKIFSKLDELKLCVKAVLFTHAHFDHISAANDLVSKYNCPAYIHSEDFPLLNDSDLNLSKRFFDKNISFDYDIKTFNSNDILDLISLKIRSIHTPGHTMGSCCFLIDKAIFTGDTLFRLGVGNEFPPYGNLSLEIKEIKDKLMPLQGDIVCYPGHGSSTTISYEKDNNPYLREGEAWI